ncbi:hypothetical protein K437DRAFT_189856 [Tilletiaria anomala UBC 951]|uniref:Uncharacterized protein n=1 Tax=Tilletiaria anomala (strain ATCC 24038 / CBS 436.72 / UBC 951) TaxID=1037660 RepID=A0A066VNM2_TILAU|nr:uncharacterized protein K437DRAFT_189856 [Tilletiaria anomala UBC 951]KDN40334.1 hypothetical protein K437DRAFT_189856 [Tilletiaria anomala UBC 951]
MITTYFTSKVGELLVCFIIPSKHGCEGVPRSAPVWKLPFWVTETPGLIWPAILTRSLSVPFLGPFWLPEFWRFRWMPTVSRPALPAVDHGIEPSCESRKSMHIWNTFIFLTSGTRSRGYWSCLMLRPCNAFIKSCNVPPKEASSSPTVSLLWSSCACPISSSVSRGSPC